jgi:DNA invertase Pin-like site-specific DNA recombinase
MAKLKLTPELEEEILNLIRAGNYAKDACLAVGIDESTYYRWLRTGEKAKSGKLYQFYQSIQKARAFARALSLRR